MARPGAAEEEVTVVGGMAQGEVSSGSPQAEDEEGAAAAAGMAQGERVWEVAEGRLQSEGGTEEVAP